MSTTRSPKIEPPAGDLAEIPAAFGTLAATKLHCFTCGEAIAQQHLQKTVTYLCPKGRQLQPD